MSTIPKPTDEELEQVAYWWLHRGDLERWSGWKECRPKLEVHCPEIVRAWDAHNASYRILSDAVKKYTMVPDS